MGHKSSPKYHKSLNQLCYQRLTTMLSDGVGHSKKADKANGDSKEKIYSYKTYKTYREQSNAFTRWMGNEHPEITTMKKARKFVPVYLQMLTEDGKSAWTIHTAAAALNKIFGISLGDKDYFSPPPRERKDITRSRGDAARDKQFSEENNAEFVAFCRGTGLRREELRDLLGRDLYTRDEIKAEISKINETQDRTEKDNLMLDALRNALVHPSAEYYVFVANGKGGKMRYAPVVGSHAQDIVRRMRETEPDNKVWIWVPDKADIHSYRAEYCSYMYRSVARNIKDIPYDKINQGTGRRYQSQVYTCRKDENHKKLDKAAMQICSKAMGHNRLDVMAMHYLRGI